MASAVVTGAAGAIGAAVAARLASDGFDVVATDVSGDVDVRCDLRDEQQVAALRDAAADRAGPPQVLVNVAGVFFEHDVPETTVEQYQSIMDTNVMGTFLTCRAFLPAMIDAGQAASSTSPRSLGFGRGTGGPSTTPARRRWCCSRAAWRSTTAPRACASTASARA